MHWLDLELSESQQKEKYSNKKIPPPTYNKCQNFPIIL